MTPEETKKKLREVQILICVSMACQIVALIGWIGMMVIAALKATP
jgi:hypothetical protein